MKIKPLHLIQLVCFSFLVIGCGTNEKKKEIVQGWNILSDDYGQALKTIEAAREYNINHLQLSHDIIMDLKDLKKEGKPELVNDLTKRAKAAGIKKVFVWDHALYNLDYYPDSFKVQNNTLINLDDPEFWQWLKQDYREMLDLIPEVSGVVLTFIETGAHVEDQYSAKLQTEEAKLAALVDTLAKVIIDERKMDLYIRTFMYTREEKRAMVKCVNLVQHPAVKVMVKEVPHDFFLTHPTSTILKDFKRPAIIEYDAAHEYNGQGIVASCFPAVHLRRLRKFLSYPHVEGYVARTDRFANTCILNNPAEVNLFALKAGTENPSQKDEDIVASFVEKKYGKEAVAPLTRAFLNVENIIGSVFYTLGLCTNSHSAFHYLDDSGYQRHVSGKWMDKPVVHIAHNVNKDFHYWKDVVNHLSEPWYKQYEGTQLGKESRWVLDSNWLQAQENMTPEYLEYIIKEKRYGLQLAEESLELVKSCSSKVQDKALYDTLLHVFERTALTARLYLAGAKVYFGYRVFARGEKYKTPFVKKTLEEGINEVPTVARSIIAYPHTGPQGQFKWKDDAYRALEYHQAVVSRKNDSYYKGFFHYFPYHYSAEEAYFQKNKKVQEK